MLFDKNKQTAQISLKATKISQANSSKLRNHTDKADFFRVAIILILCA